MPAAAEPIVFNEVILPPGEPDYSDSIPIGVKIDEIVLPGEEPLSPFTRQTQAAVAEAPTTEMRAQIHREEMERRAGLRPSLLPPRNELDRLAAVENRERLQLQAEHLGIPHFTGSENEPEGDRAPTIDMENIVVELKKREAAATGQERLSLATDRAYWENEIATSGMSAEEWKKGSGEDDPRYFETRLNPDQEPAFQEWKKRAAPNDSGEDYDFRGAFVDGVQPNESGHWPDTFKKPNHPTFSNQSIYAKDRPELAGRWEGDKFIPPISKAGLPFASEAEAVASADALRERSPKIGELPATLLPPELTGAHALGSVIKSVFPQNETAQIVGESLQGVGEGIAGLTAIEMLPLLAAGGPASRFGQALLAAGFEAEAVSHIPEALKQIDAAETKPEKAGLWATLLTGLAVPAAAGGHALLGRRPSASVPRPPAGTPVRPASAPEQVPATLEQRLPVTEQETAGRVVVEPIQGGESNAIIQGIEQKGGEQQYQGTAPLRTEPEGSRSDRAAPSGEERAAQPPETRDELTARQGGGETTRTAATSKPEAAEPIGITEAIAEIERRNAPEPKSVTETAVIWQEIPSVTKGGKRSFWITKNVQYSKKRAVVWNRQRDKWTVTDENDQVIREFQTAEEGKRFVESGEQAEPRVEQTKPVAPAEGLPEGFVSVGASTGADIPAPKVTAIKNAAVDKARVERGELPLMEPARKSNPETWEEAMERLEKDTEHANKVVDGILSGTKKEIDAADQMVILHEEIRLRNERTMEAERAADPYSTPEERTQASEGFEKLSERINKVELAGHDAGTMSGRALQIRQQMIRDDYTPAGIERRMAAKKGGPLTEEEVASAKADSEKITKEVEAFEARVEQVKTEKVKADAAAALKEMEGGKPKKPVTPKDTATEVAGIVDGIKAAAEEGATLGGGLDTYVKRLAKKFVDGGMRGLENVTAAIEKVLKPILPEINARQIHDLFSDYGKSKPAPTEPVKVHLSQIRGEAQKTSALQDIIEKQKAPLATGPQRVPQSEISRRLTKQINEAKKRFNIQPTDPARALKTALESRKTYYTNKLADLRFEIAKGARIIKEKSLPPTDPALEALKAEYEQLKSEHTEIFGKRELTPEQRLKSAIAVAERAELEAIKRLENAQKGIFGTTKTPSKVPPSAQLDAIRARTEAIREQVKELHDLANPKKTPEERALQSYKTRLKTQEAELLEKNLRADAGDATAFAKKVRKPIDISRDPEAMRLKATVEKSKQELGRKAEAYRLANRSLGKKIVDGILMSYDASTNLLSALDLSAPRQGAFGLAQNAPELLLHPHLVLKPFKKMFQVLTSDARSRRFEQERLHRPNAINGIDRQAKVEYTALDEIKFSKKEENARSILDEWAQYPLRTGNLPKTAVTLAPKLISRGVHISNRAFNTFLNTARADLLDHLLAINFKDRAPTKVELEAIGNMVNVSFGRGKLRPATVEVGGRILWSPKLLFSRIQTLAGQPFYKGSMRTRKIVAKQYAKAIGTGIAILKIQQLFSDRNEDDSRSSDFGKMVDGNTRLDIWGGLQQVLVQEERQRTGQTKTSAGKVINLRDKTEDGVLSTPLSSGKATAKNDKKAYGQSELLTAANFLRTKLRPQLGAFWNWKTGENVIGEKTTAASTVKDLTVSLAWKDIVELLEEQGMTKGAAYQAAQIFGAGVQTYEPREKKSTSTKRIQRVSP